MMADRSEGSVALVSERERPAPKLAVSHLVKTRRSTSGETVTAVDDVTFEVRQGEFVCLLGPSGCGKTTILNILAGLDQPTSGSALLDGKPIPGPGPDRAVLFQEPALFPWLSVVANVELALKHVGVAHDERRTRAMSWLENVHLTGNANAQPHELSCGHAPARRAGARLACDPDVLLATSRSARWTRRRASCCRTRCSACGSRATDARRSCSSRTTSARRRSSPIAVL
jgi:NitT/TauT family transport system ATP-binding protein